MKQWNFYLGETKQYDKFSFREANRDINQSNINKIRKSIEKIGLQCPIMVNSDHEIIDGQHRFVVLRELQMVVPYVISKKWTNDDDLSKLQESRKWTALDFCNSLATRGDISCKRAIELAEKWYKETAKKMSKIRTIELLLDGKGSTGLLTRLKNQSYLINEDCAQNVFDCINIMEQIDMGTSAYGQKIIRPLKNLYYDFNGIEFDVIEHMTTNNYIKAYLNESDQVRYMTDMYKKSLKALGKN